MKQQQQPLPFAEAEGSYAERKALLWVALNEVKADLRLVRLCEWVFEQTAGGTMSSVAMSCQDLGAKPWLLRCDIRTARRKLVEAVKRGLLTVEEVFDGDGRQTSSRMAIDWPRIRATLGIASNPPRMVGQNVLPGGHPGSNGGAPGVERIPAGETPRARAPRVRGPNETNEPMKPMKEAQASQPTPMEESLVSSRSAGRGPGARDPLHVSHAIAAVTPQPLSADDRRALRERLKARIAHRIDDPDCHDSLPGRVADMVVWDGVAETKVNAILDSLAAARRRGAIHTSPGAWANKAFARLARIHGLDWGKADDG